LDVGISGYALGIGILRKRSEAKAELLMLGMGQLLGAEEDHLMPEQRRFDFSKGFVGQLGNRNAANLGTHCRRQGFQLDQSGRQRLVAELPGRVKAHHDESWLRQMTKMRPARLHPWAASLSCG